MTAELVEKRLPHHADYHCGKSYARLGPVKRETRCDSPVEAQLPVPGSQHPAVRTFGKDYREL